MKEKLIMPDSPMSLYCMLFCKKYNKSECEKQKMLDAMKSWASLDKNEKSKFFEKYKAYNRDYENKFAAFLKEVKPYMKKKKIRRVQKDINTKDKIPTLEMNTLENSTLEINTIENSTVQNDVPMDDCTNNVEEPMQDLVHTKDYSVKTEDAVVNTSCNISKPIPPKYNNSRELFESVKTIIGQGDTSWENLTNIEKRRYGDVLRTIKKQYIKDLQIYLESLTREELYEYYEDCSKL